MKKIDLEKKSELEVILFVTDCLGRKIILHSQIKVMNDKLIAKYIQEK